MYGLSDGRKFEFLTCSPAQAVNGAKSIKNLFILIITSMFCYKY